MPQGSFFLFLSTLPQVEVRVSAIAVDFQQSDYFGRVPSVDMTALSSSLSTTTAWRGLRVNNGAIIWAGTDEAAANRQQEELHEELHEATDRATEARNASETSDEQADDALNLHKGTSM